MSYEQGSKGGLRDLERSLTEDRQIPGSPGEVDGFREMLFALSAGLISMPAAEMGREIARGLALVGKFFGFEWVFVAQLRCHESEIVFTDSYTDAALALRSISVENIQWFLSEMVHRDTLLMTSLPDQLPEGAKAERDFCVMNSVRSCLILKLPSLKGGESAQSLLLLLSLREAVPWTAELIRLLNHFGEILANALERKRAADRGEEVLLFERLLSEVSAAYITLPGNEFEKVIKNDLARIGQLLLVDRCVLQIRHRDGEFSTADSCYVWDSEGKEGPLSLEHMEARDPKFREWVRNQLLKSVCGQFPNIDSIPEEAAILKHALLALGVKSFLALPVFCSGSPQLVLVIATTRFHRTWPEELIPRLRLFAEAFANALVRKRTEEKLRTALSEISQLKDRIEADYVYLREEIKLVNSFSDIVGKSDALRRILTKAEQVACTDATVLILGETGTGKGLIARAIHNVSKRKDRPFMQVNCAALTPSLIETELFGHEKGAFTGAETRRIGRFEAARGTTLFLDEVGDLPLDLQPKLLRVLHDGEFERVGGSVTIKTDVRVITATNRNLEAEVKAGRFRRDLWYRLATFPILVPPLRERAEDIPLFVSWFVDKYAKKMGRHFDRIPQKTIRALQSYAWPGNVRELENIIERAAITSLDGTLRVELPTTDSSRPLEEKETLEEIEREHILKVVRETSWKISGPNGAAQRLGLNHSTLRSRMKKLNIERPL
jgi:formate hydrogenlyase transcriptional activator